MANEAWRQFNCYNVLGVSSTAGPDEIRTAYRRMSLKTHPDSAGGTHEGQVRVNLAYEVLSDPVLRQAHDFHWVKASATAKPKTESVQGAPRTSTAQPRRPPQAEPKAHRESSSSSVEELFKRVKERIDIESTKIWANREEKINSTTKAYEQRYQDGLRNRRWGFVVSVGLTIAALGQFVKGPILWIAAVTAWVYFLIVAQGIQIGSCRVSFSDQEWRSKLRSCAAEDIDATCRKEEARLNDYLGHVAALGQLASRSSTLDDSEEHIARRITAALFLMGYIPTQYDRQSRVLVFADGDEKLVVRFRHRSGIPTNISYVERMVSAMNVFGARKGLLFCTPGLSDNAALLAERSGIKSYSLSRMNDWISSVLSSRYAGPPGDIFSSLDILMRFIAQVATPLPFYSRRRKYR